MNRGCHLEEKRRPASLVAQRTAAKKIGGCDGDAPGHRGVCQAAERHTRRWSDVVGGLCRCSVL